MDEAVILESNSLVGGYSRQAVIRGVNLTIAKGEWLSIIGANGSGKSTLLRLLSRLLAPRGGVVLLNGRNIHTQPVRLVAQELALLPQQPVIPQGITVAQLVSLGRHPYQAWWQWELDPIGKEKVSAALAYTQLLDCSDRPVETLSGGERQRAFLALALAQSPQVLLLDEPTTFLDLRYQLELLAMLKKLQHQQGLTIVTVLHDMNLASRYSDRIAVLCQGELLAVDVPERVLTPEIIAQAFGIKVEILYINHTVYVQPFL